MWYIPARKSRSFTMGHKGEAMGFMPPPWFLSGSIGGNAVKLVMDRGGWDRIFRAAEQRNLIPVSPAGKWGATALLFMIGAFTDWNMKKNTAGSKLLGELLDDIPSEIGSRLMSSRSTVFPKQGTSLASRALEQVSDFLFPWFK